MLIVNKMLLSSDPATPDEEDVATAEGDVWVGVCKIRVASAVVMTEDLLDTVDMDVAFEVELSDVIELLDI